MPLWAVRTEFGTGSSKHHFSSNKPENARKTSRNAPSLSGARVPLVALRSIGGDATMTYKNSSGDEIANVLVNDDIAHT